MFGFKRFGFLGLAVLAVGLVIAAFWWGRRQAAAHALPPLALDSRLPEPFNQALESRYARAKSHPAEPDALRALAHLYQANRHFAEARACYAALAHIGKGLSARDHYYLAGIAENENDLAGVQRELARVVQEEPSYLPSRLLLAEAYMKSGKVGAAAKELTAIRAIEPNQAEASLDLARLALQNGKEHEAAGILKALLSAHPHCAAAAAIYAPILERHQEHERASAMTIVSQQKPEPPIADPWREALLADCYDVQRLAITCEEDFKRGQTDEAVPLLDRIVRLDPKNPIGPTFAGFARAREGDHEAAVREYYTALNEGGSAEKIGPLLTQSLLALGRFSEANNLIAKFCAKMPESMPLTKANATVAMREGNDQRARPLLEKVLQKEPYLREQNMELARILWASGEYDAAAPCLQRVAFVYTDDVPSRALLGEYFLRKGMPGAAIKPLEQAYPFVPPNTPEQESVAAMLVTAHLRSGDELYKTGNITAARQAWQRAEQFVAPTDSAARDALSTRLRNEATSQGAQ